MFFLCRLSPAGISCREDGRVIYYICTWASQGFDRGLAAGEAIRRLMRQIANLNINAEDNLAYAA